MESMRRVEAVRPVAPYIGGKRNLARRIVELIEAIPHELYAEPFVGMGGIFFRRHLVPKAEVINDFNQDVANLFRILQRHYVPFMEMMRFQLTTRAEFERLRETNPDTLTDLERAARFLYLQRTTYGGKRDASSFGVRTDGPSRFNITTLGPMLEDLHDRLAGVGIERLAFGDFITRYDRPHVLFYLDPPYYGCEDYYGKGLFERTDFDRLAILLRSLKGRFIMSLNDVSEVREIFAEFTIEEVSTTYTVSSQGSSKRAAELLISSSKLGGRRKRR